MLKHSFLCILSIFLLPSTFAQVVEFTDGSKVNELDFIAWNGDSLLGENASSYFYSELVKYGYWDLQLDSLVLAEEKWKGFGKLGDLYQYSGINIHHKIRNFVGKPRNYFDKFPLKERRAKVLEYYLDHGYPFAKVYYDSLSISGGIVSARMNVSENGLQLIDSLVIKSNDRFSEKVLRQMIQFRAGQVYNSSEILKLSEILNQYSFLRSTAEPRVLFTPKKNVLYVYIAEEKAHYFDGLIGFASDEAGDVSFRGKLEFKLENAFHRGEEIYLKWDAQGEKFQSLKTHVAMPFIVSSWGAEVDLKIYKQDSSFVKTDYSIGVQYFWKSFWKLGLGVENSESSITKDVVLATDVLSAYEKTLYYSKLNYQKLDRTIQSKEGGKFDLILKAGTRDENEISSSEYLIDLDFAWYFPLRKSFSIKTGLTYKNRITEGLSDNNLLFLGGSQNMRGFLENQFQLSSYVVLSPSVRYHFSQDYMLEIFTDQGLTYHPSDAELNEKHIWSGGMQIEMPIKSGWLYLGYGIGKQGDSTFDISEGVVHFGLRNIF